MYGKSSIKYPIQFIVQVLITFEVETFFEYKTLKLYLNLPSVFLVVFYYILIKRELIRNNNIKKHVISE